MDTSEPFGNWFSSQDEKLSTVGARRDHQRWSCWADLIILVNTTRKLRNDEYLCLQTRCIQLPVRTV